MKNSFEDFNFNKAYEEAILADSLIEDNKDKEEVENAAELAKEMLADSDNEAQHVLLRENFVKMQLDLDKIKKSPDENDIGKKDIEKKYKKTKKDYYESLNKKEDSNEVEKAKFVTEEFNRLQDVKTNLRGEAEAQKAYFPLNKIKEIGNWYKKQPAKQKYIVAAGLIGGGFLSVVSGSAILAGAVGTTAMVSRILSGAGTAVALETAIAQGKGKKFGMQVGHKGLMEEKTLQEIEKIRKGLDVKSAADFFEQNESELSEASERLEKESKKLETERAVIAGAAGLVVGSGVLGEALKNVMHWTGVDKSLNNSFNWIKEKIGFGEDKAIAGGAVENNMASGNEAVKDVSKISTENANVNNPEVHHYVSEIKSGGNVYRTAMEAGHQAGATPAQINEALEHTLVKDVHGKMIPLSEADLSHAGTRLEYIIGKDGHPIFNVTKPEGVGAFGRVDDLYNAQNDLSGGHTPSKYTVEKFDKIFSHGDDKILTGHKFSSEISATVTMNNGEISPAFIKSIQDRLHEGGNSEAFMQNLKTLSNTAHSDPTSIEGMAAGRVLDKELADPKIINQILQEKTGHTMQELKSLMHIRSSVNIDHLSANKVVDQANKILEFPNAEVSTPEKWKLAKILSTLGKSSVEGHEKTVWESLLDSNSKGHIVSGKAFHVPSSVENSISLEHVHGSNPPKFSDVSYDKTPISPDYHVLGGKVPMAKPSVEYSYGGNTEQVVEQFRIKPEDLKASKTLLKENWRQLLPSNTRALGYENVEEKVAYLYKDQEVLKHLQENPKINIQEIELLKKKISLQVRLMEKTFGKIFTKKLI